MGAGKPDAEKARYWQQRLGEAARSRDFDPGVLPAAPAQGEPVLLEAGWRIASAAVRFVWIKQAGSWSRRTRRLDNRIGSWPWPGSKWRPEFGMKGISAHMGRDVNRRVALTLRQPGMG